MHRAVRLAGLGLVSALVVCLSAGSVASAQGRGGGELADRRQRPAADVVGPHRREDFAREPAAARIPAAVEGDAREPAAAARVADPAAAAAEHHFLQGLQGPRVRRRQRGQRLLDRLRPQSDVLEGAPVERRLRGRHRGVPRGAHVDHAGRGDRATGAPAGRGGRGGGGGGGFGGGNTNVYAISSGGMVHVLNVQTGEDLNPPIKFLPAGANVVGTMAAGTTLYAATTDACGGAANGVYALDMANNANTVKSWDAKGAAIAGNVAPTFGTDGTVYVATGAGGIRVRQRRRGARWHRAHGQGLVRGSHAVRVGPGRLPASGQRHRRGGQQRRPDLPAGRRLARRRRSQDAAREVAAVCGRCRLPGRGPVDMAGCRRHPLDRRTVWRRAGWRRRRSAAANGAVTNGALVAFKLGAERNADARTGWISRDLASPTAPLVMNGVVFVVSGGGAPRRRR